MKWINCKEELPPLDTTVFIKFWNEKHLGGIFSNWLDDTKNGILTISGHIYLVYSPDLKDFVWLKEN